jgi:hypothetical protein
MLANEQLVVDEIKNASAQLLQTLAGFNEQQINHVPEPGSWSAAEVGEHVYLSMNTMDEVLRQPGKKADRPYDEQVDGIRKMFLDFSTKMESPEFIRPALKDYNKEELLSKLSDVFERALAEAPQADLHDIVSIPSFGEPSKFELLNFVAVHTKRHVHQLEKIAAKVLV